MGKKNQVDFQTIKTTLKVSWLKNKAIDKQQKD